MQKHLLSFLVGLLMLATARNTVSARIVSVLDAIDEEKAVLSNLENAVLQENIIEEVEKPETFDDLEKPRKVKNKKILRPYVNTEMSVDQVTLVQGQSYNLTCTSYGYPPATIYWTRGENPENQINKILKQHNVDPVDYIAQKVASIKSTYLINCADELDEGPIHCIAISGSKNSSKSAYISVKENEGFRGCPMKFAPVITKIMPFAFVNEGYSLTIPCGAEGNPKATIAWLDNNNKLIQKETSKFRILRNGYLLVKDLNWKNDQGVYTCVAKSPLGFAEATTYIYPTLRETSEETELRLQMLE